MVRQYPYNLFVYSLAESTYDEATGNYSNPSEPEWKPYGKCRDEVNSSGRKATTTDGEVYDYSWIIYCPLFVSDINKGVKVRIIDDSGNIRAEKEIIRFSRDQLHCRISV